ncbi:LysE family translocator [Oceanicoccus sp. KOV_DT_Chl]|uniref:LysE family translocator n=1 Tax=Oceanicoccus sp. KOV_DT_Chl TaxID=1904639 RepID=UPI000C7E480E|nr:LysE family transporter [Oceanicoccus sp. KOV_DT_Chl]
MTTTTWLSLLTLCALGAMSPGPSLAVIIQITAKSNRQHGIVAAIAHGLGIACYALLAALGLAVVITQNPAVFSGLKILGAGFLLYLGFKALGLLPNQTPPAPHNQQASYHTETLSRSFRVGFSIAILNPKVALFFLALFSQFVSEQADLSEKLMMAGTAATIDAAWYCLVASAVSRPQVMAMFTGYSDKLEKLFGVLIICLAVLVIIN